MLRFAALDKILQPGAQKLSRYVYRYVSRKWVNR